MPANGVFDSLHRAAITDGSYHRSRASVGPGSRGPWLSLVLSLQRDAQVHRE